MAKYLSPEAKKQRARRRKMRRLAMFSCLAAFVLIVSYGIVSVIEFLTPDKQPNDNLLTPPTPAGDLVPNDSLEFEGEWQQGFIGPVEKTINEFGVIAPDHRMFQLPQNGSVDLSYFADAVFVGDSLTEGLRIYHGIENAISNIAKFVSTKSLTPKSFTEGVIQFQDGYRPTQNGVEAIVAENPKKIYITLGTNSMVSMTDEQFIYYYDKLLTQLQEQLPDATYYVCSLTPTLERIVPARPYFHYDHMYSVNNQIANLATQKGMHFINLYEALAGENGYLIPDFCTAQDGIHITPSAYSVWIQYLMTHTVHDAKNPYVPGSPYYTGM